MSSFLVIRPYREEDFSICREIIKDYTMSFANKSFLSCLFKEITIQCIVIVWAILFIFLGVPLPLCALSIPGCILGIFLATHVSCFLKSVELINEKPKICWVAEAYEPFILQSKPADLTYEIFENESPYDKNYLNKFRQKLVGTISVKNHNTIPNAAFVYRLAINPHYALNAIAAPMLNIVGKSCFDFNYRTIELVITEWQEEARDFYYKLGFITRQIYHKQIIGSNLCVTKSQLTIDLYEWFSTKTE